MTITNVKAHTRRPPEKPADPFKPVMEARKARFCRKWLVDPANTDDPRLSRPVADPAPGGPSLAWIAEQLNKLADLWNKVGR